MIDDSAEGVILVAITVVLVALYISCGILAHDSGFKKGYTEALQDMKKKNPPKYILVDQEDGTTVWEENKEK